MRKLFLLFIMFFSLSAVQVQAQSVDLANALLRAGKYGAARKEAEKVLQHSPNNSQAQRIIAQCREHAADLDMEFDYDLDEAASQGSDAVKELMNRAEVRRVKRHYNKAKSKLEELLRAEDDERYNVVCESGESALRQFVETNTESSTRHYAEAKERLQLYTTWNQTKSVNTLSAYRNFLSQYGSSSFADDARKEIAKLEEHEEWTAVNQNKSESKLEAFISKYPSSAHISEAKYLLNVERGDRSFASNQLASAKNYYAEAIKFRFLPSSSQKNYDAIMLEDEYQQVMKSSDFGVMSNFLNKVSNDSQKSTSVSNRIAMTLADRFNDQSTDYNFNQALQFARTDDVRRYVESKKDAAEEAHRAYVARQRRIARKMWWEDHFQAGFIHGFAFGGRKHNEKDYVTDELFAGLNVRFHFGGFALLFGTNYQYNGHLEDTGKKDSDGTSKLEGGVVTHQVVPRVGFQIGKSGDDLYDESNFYFACYLDYGINLYEKKKKYDIDGMSYFNKKTLSIVPMIGINSNKVDCGLYCRYYLPGKGIFQKEAYEVWGSKETSDRLRVGLQLTYKF